MQPPPTGVPPRMDVVVQQQPPSPRPDAWIDALTDAAWPLAAVIIVLVLRRSIGEALRGLAGRATSLSIGMLAFELGESRARSIERPAVLDQIRDRAKTAQVADATAALLASLQDTTPADYAVIHLGDGEEWLTSRLFAVATLVARVRGLRGVVFTIPDPLGPKLLGTASIDDLRQSLAWRYPWLELASAHAWASAFGPAGALERSQPDLLPARPTIAS